MNEINAAGTFITLDLMVAMIDCALAKGAKIEDLRWRVSPAQRTQVLKFFASGELDLQDRNDLMIETFNLAGITGKVDPSVPAGEIWLDQLVPQTVGKATGLMLPKYY